MREQRRMEQENNPHYLKFDNKIKVFFLSILCIQPVTTLLGFNPECYSKFCNNVLTEAQERRDKQHR